MRSLATAYLQHRGGPPTQAALSRLESRLVSLVEGARRAWPGVGLADEGFAAHLASLAMPAGADPEEALPSESSASELFLCWACGQGDPAALAHVERSFLADLLSAVERLRLPAGVDAPEVLQRLREKLLVSKEGAPARITHFAGIGALSNWLRTAAVREVVSLARRAHPQGDPEDLLLDLPLPASDPELALAKARFKPAFQAAFRQAIAALSAEERNLLRLHFLDQVSLDRIGVVYGTHKSTLSRRLGKIRAAILDRTRLLLAEELALQQESLDSLMRLLDTSLEVTLPPLLLEIRTEE